ncbi:protein-glutamate O-methyltransferase CheR [Fictibacillus sp. Mic-4]|uniref:CheR family methyltransferase n=1 Tax=Fictibacillus TaxID=1329200 RepID=UPI000409EC1F|nr:protein-glutamate O-methyltransferase CheR [Fictibacillus gelatini]
MEVDRDYATFIEKIKKKTGIDLSLYKEAQMKRRLTSFRDKKNYKNFTAFFDALTKDESLLEEFFDRVTINVSEFYRNPKRWEVLEQKILPQLAKGRSRLKIWSAACSTGEEPYTISIILSRSLKQQSFSILATDLDDQALKQAEKGFYFERSLSDVPKEILRSYFMKNEMGYVIRDDVKKPIQFKKHNLLADSFDGNYDLIICRNVMIYFTEEAKNELYQKFSRALRPGGFLFVGSTEQIFNPSTYGLEAAEPFFYKKNQFLN